jgi:hypothetical protein
MLLVVAGLLTFASMFGPRDGLDPEVYEDSAEQRAATVRYAKSAAGVGGVLFVLGWPLLIHGQLGVWRETAEQDRERVRQQQAAAAAKESARREAQQLTLQARNEASEGYCSAVLDRERRVRELDAEYHAKVFVRDVAIKRCLDAPDEHAPEN